MGIRKSVGDPELHGCQNAAALAAGVDEAEAKLIVQRFQERYPIPNSSG